MERTDQSSSLLVDARVDGIQLFNIRGKATLLPDKVPVLRFARGVARLTNSRAVVVYDLPDDLHLEEDSSVSGRI